MMFKKPFTWIVKFIAPVAPGSQFQKFLENLLYSHIYWRKTKCMILISTNSPT